MKKCYLPVVVLLLGLLLTACGGPKVLTMRVAGAPDINDTGDGPNAATVRIYQLTGTTNFERATPEQFWGANEATLGDELISSQQVRLFPNQEEEIILDPAENAVYIGVAANLRRPDPDAWRQVYPVEELRGKRVRITVGAGDVTLRVE